VLLEKATEECNRRAEVFTKLALDRTKYGLLTADRLFGRSGEVLRDQSHREFVNRPFQFHKRSQLFIRTHNETLSVAAVGVNNLHCSVSVAHTDRVRIVFDCRMADDPAMMSSTNPIDNNGVA
jgi:hypothetical protein